MATEIELINFNAGDTHLAIGYYKDNQTQLVSVPLSDFQKWAKENSRLKVLNPVYEDGNVVDHDELPINFDTYLSLLDKDEITEFLKSKKFRYLWNG